MKEVIEKLKAAAAFHQHELTKLNTALNVLTDTSKQEAPK